jgi:hypothetical protein
LMFRIHGRQHPGSFYSDTAQGSRERRIRQLDALSFTNLTRVLLRF